MEDDYLNMFFCVKYANGKKLNSHLWFFRGFCDLLEPDYVMLIDCGLEVFLYKNLICSHTVLTKLNF